MVKWSSIWRCKRKCELPSKEYPYIFNTGRGTVGQWHTQTRTREIPIVNKTTPKDPYIELSKELADELNIMNGDKIIVKSSKWWICRSWC